MKAKIYLTYKEGILDPEGNAVKRALKSIGFNSVDTVQFGKYIEMTFTGVSKEEAEKLTDEACRKLLANPNTQSYRFEVAEQ
ncbi:MAG: phosphoribosylformylglycinamidine synthase subunit PurS [Candidatus Marinimicrobia bacterium]|nr:phosphoribosylformylglycinamidine synthase subunit PurS [Candidatus Neomarinimicrobiota bacterium]